MHKRGIRLMAVVESRIIFLSPRIRRPTQKPLYVRTRQAHGLHKLMPMKMSYVTYSELEKETRRRLLLNWDSLSPETQGDLMAAYTVACNSNASSGVLPAVYCVRG